MSADLEKAIGSILEELKKIEERAQELKKTVNSLSVLAGKTPPFTDTGSSISIQSGSFRPDQFYGKALSTAVREFLAMRGYSATSQEIYDGLKLGGFEFPKEWLPKFQIKNLAISLSKNRADFVYVKSNNSYGLWEFYPEKKREREKRKEIKISVLRDTPFSTNDEDDGEGGSK